MMSAMMAPMSMHSKYRYTAAYRFAASARSMLPEPEKLSRYSSSAPPASRKDRIMPRIFASRFPSCRMRDMFDAHSAAEKSRIKGNDKSTYRLAEPVSSARI